MPYQFTIIIPVYNEEANLERLEQELLRYIKIASKTTTILFVNDQVAIAKPVKDKSSLK